MPGTVRGILLQVTRFLYYLLRVETSDVVSLELFEDVGVEFADGRKIAEQDKSIRSANPLADRSRDLWKTLHNWVDSVAEARLDANRTRFVIYAPHAGIGSIAGAFHDADTYQKAHVALKTARALLTGQDGRWALGSLVRESVEATYRADPNLVATIISRFTVDTSDDLDSQLKPLLRDLLVGEEALDDVIHWAQGWVKNRIEQYLNQGEPAQVGKLAFRDALSHYVRRHDRIAILRSVAAKPTRAQVEAELEERNYVRQLRLIALEYTMTFLKPSTIF